MFSLSNTVVSINPVCACKRKNVSVLILVRDYRAGASRCAPPIKATARHVASFGSDLLLGEGRCCEALHLKGPFSRGIAKPLVFGQLRSDLKGFYFEVLGNL